jgi:hypothetical protein
MSDTQRIAAVIENQESSQILGLAVDHARLQPPSVQLTNVSDHHIRCIILFHSLQHCSFHICHWTHVGNALFPLPVHSLRCRRFRGRHHNVSRLARSERKETNVIPTSARGSVCCQRNDQLSGCCRVLATDYAGKVSRPIPKESNNGFEPLKMSLIRDCPRYRMHS